MDKKALWKKYVWNSDEGKMVSKSYLLPFLRDRYNWLWFAMFEAFNVLDWVLTQMAVRNGFVEMNPNWHNSVTGVFAAISKIVLAPAAAILISGFFRPNISRNLIRLFTIMFFVVCAVNMWGLAHPYEGDHEPYTQWQMAVVAFVLAAIAMVILGAMMGAKRALKWWREGRK